MLTIEVAASAPVRAAICGASERGYRATGQQPAGIRRQKKVPQRKNSRTVTSYANRPFSQSVVGCPGALPPSRTTPPALLYRLADYVSGFGAALESAGSSLGTAALYLLPSEGVPTRRRNRPTSRVGVAVSAFTTALGTFAIANAPTPTQAKALITARAGVVDAYSVAGFSAAPEPGSVVFNCTTRLKTTPLPGCVGR